MRIPDCIWLCFWLAGCLLCWHCCWLCAGPNYTEIIYVPIQIRYFLMTPHHLSFHIEIKIKKNNFPELIVCRAHWQATFDYPNTNIKQTIPHHTFGSNINTIRNTYTAIQLIGLGMRRSQIHRNHYCFNINRKKNMTLLHLLPKLKLKFWFSKIP